MAISIIEDVLKEQEPVDGYTESGESTDPESSDSDQVCL